MSQVISTACSLKILFHVHILTLPGTNPSGILLTASGVNTASFDVNTLSANLALIVSTVKAQMADPEEPFL